MKNNSTTSTETIASAVEQFLGRKHYEIVARNYSDLVDFVCTDEEGSIVFFSVFASNGVEEGLETVSRHAAEFDMFSYLIANDMVESNQNVRFDTVCLYISSANRAMLRHAKGARLFE